MTRKKMEQSKVSLFGILAAGVQARAIRLQIVIDGKCGRCADLERRKLACLSLDERLVCPMRQ